MITPGAILFQEGTVLPQPLRLEAGPHTGGWSAIAGHLNGHQINAALGSDGWTFFYMAGATRAKAFGFDRTRMVDAALGRLIANVKLQKCNCLQIDEVAMHSFLGMPYVSLSAHSRHIQQGNVFSGR